MCVRMCPLSFEEAQDALEAREQTGRARVKRADRVPAYVPGPDGGLVTVTLTWGFSLEGKKGSVYNTRIESALEQLRQGRRGMWANAIARGRCLVPVRAFYEGHRAETVLSEKTGKPVRRQYRFRLQHAGAFLLAGVQQEGQLSIVTTRPNAAVSPVHDRMPLVLGAGESSIWLGADFATLARRYSDDEACKNVGGVLPWMPVNKNMQEWIDKLESLERNKISAPFYSPMGIHIVKWIDRRQGVSFEEKREQLLNYLEKNGNCTWKELSAEQKEELEFRVQELQDGLLAAYLSQKYQSGDEAWNEDDLERFFKQHKSDYAWELPHYRGAVIHCKDRKTASAIKKQLKKKPVSQWKDILHTLTGDDASSKVRMEAGVFQIGTNRYIDKLVFKCGSFQPEPDLPYTFVMGKKLKKGPESYEDVREAVVKDYLTVYEDAWLKDLKRKYKVEINQEVLKTVNNNGSN